MLIEGGVSCWSVKNFKSDKEYNLKDVVVELHNKRGWVLQPKVFCTELKIKILQKKHLFLRRLNFNLKPACLIISRYFFHFSGSFIKFFHMAMYVGV